MSTGRIVYVESGIRGSRRLRFLLLSLRSLLVDQSLVFFEEFPAFALVFPALALLGFLVVLVVLASHLLALRGVVLFLLCSASHDFIVNFTHL